jgi:beta-glucanase (GH16 family)
MNKALPLICWALLAIVSCTGTDQPEPPGPEPPGPVVPPEPKHKDVTLMGAFLEEFSSREGSESFGFTLNQVRDDFRYYPGFPSLSENGKTILMLRVDPKDVAGKDKGAILTSSDFVHFGTISARVRLPDISSVQPNLGVIADLSLFDEDPVFGTDDITLQFRLADKGNVYIGDTAYKPSVSSFNAASRFYIYGIDWASDKVSWWVKTEKSATKTIIMETTEDVPQEPLRLYFRFYHSKLCPIQGNTSSVQAPLYPFELEVDWIEYTPNAE